MPRPVEGRRRYMAGLDGLRAIAVVAVVAYHLNLGWAPGGFLGVAVFFVLSGYLITDLMLAQRETTGRIALGRFWLRRARRLLPALWAMLAVVALWSALVEQGQLGALRDQVLGALLYVSNWSYVYQHVSYFASFGPPSPLGHLWSLAIEEQFYLVWPLLLVVGLRFFPRRRVLLFTLAGAAASAGAMAAGFHVAADPSRIYYGTDTRAFELLIGAALAFVLPSSRLREITLRGHRLALDAAGAFGVGVIILMVVATNEYQGSLYRGGMVVLSLATAAALPALAHPSTALGRILGIRPLRWLGVRSYGIYLWHYPIIILTTPVVDAPGTQLVRNVLQVAATLAAAAVSWRFLEEPIRRAGLVAWVRRLRAQDWKFRRIAAGMIAVTSGDAVVAVALSTVALAGVMPVRHQAPPTPHFATAISLPAHAPVQQAPEACVHASPGAAPQASPSGAPTAAPQPVAATAIGDSVMIDLAPYLQALLPNVVVDGRVSRQMNELPSVLAQLRAQHQLRSRVIIELGTNGPFDEGQLIATLQSLGPVDRVVLVNTRVPRPWESYVNQTLADVSTRIHHATVVNWYDASAGKVTYFYEDGVHPDPEGAQVLARLIAQAMDAPTATVASVSSRPRVPGAMDCGS